MAVRYKSDPKRRPILRLPLRRLALNPISN